jgi:hypothetical protein
LLQTSLQLFQLLYYMTDRPETLAADALQTDAHSAVHLFYAHGSVHRRYLANTEEQIEELKQNARALASYLCCHGVIVLGYSGWDDCLLEALNQTRTFSNNLYWLARGESSISEGVAGFLNSHANAYWVEIDDGGSFMAELHSRLCPGAPNTEMLYNPIHALLRQLGSVNLFGIQGGGKKQEQATDKAAAVTSPQDVAATLRKPEKDAGKSVSASDAPQDVETIRLQVMARLADALQTVHRAFADRAPLGRAGAPGGSQLRQQGLGNRIQHLQPIVDGKRTDPRPARCAPSPGPVSARFLLWAETRHRQGDRRLHRGHRAARSTARASHARAVQPRLLLWAKAGCRAGNRRLYRRHRAARSARGAGRPRPPAARRRDRRFPFTEIFPRLAADEARGPTCRTAAASTSALRRLPRRHYCLICNHFLIRV